MKESQPRDYTYREFL